MAKDIDELLESIADVTASVDKLQDVEDYLREIKSRESDQEEVEELKERIESLEKEIRELQSEIDVLESKDPKELDALRCAAIAIAKGATISDFMSVQDPHILDHIKNILLLGRTYEEGCSISVNGGTVRW